MRGRISPPEQAIHQIGVVRNVGVVELGELDLERSVKIALEDSSPSWFQKRDDKYLVMMMMMMRTSVLLNDCPPANTVFRDRE